MDVIGWIVFAIAVAVAFYLFGFLAGRDAAERACAATIADLRTSLRRVTGGRYLTDETGRPE